MECVYGWGGNYNTVTHTPIIITIDSIDNVEAEKISITKASEDITLITNASCEFRSQISRYYIFDAGVEGKPLTILYNIYTGEMFSQNLWTVNGYSYKPEI